MSSPEIRAALDTSVVMRLLTGQPQDLSLAARSYMAGVEQAGAKVVVSNLDVLEAYFDQPLQPEPEAVFPSEKGRGGATGGGGGNRTLE